MSIPALRSLLVALIGTVLAAPALGAPIFFDMGDGPAQTGWTAVPSSTLSATSDGVTITLASTFAGAIGDRDRGPIANGGGTEADMWRDFFFVDPGVGEGFAVTLSGLVPDASYDLTVWAFDSSSGFPPFSGRTASWEGELLNFIHTDPPETLDDYNVTFRVDADVAGVATFSGLSQIVSEPGAFVNGVRIVEAPEPGTGILVTMALLGLSRASRNRRS